VRSIDATQQQLQTDDAREIIHAIPFVPEQSGPPVEINNTNKEVIKSIKCTFIYMKQLGNEVKSTKNLSILIFLYECKKLINVQFKYSIVYNIQSAPGGMVNILEGHNIGHSKQKIVCVHVFYCERKSEIELFHCIVHYTLYRRATRHVLTRVEKCIDVDDRIFENVLSIYSSRAHCWTLAAFSVS
jgi:hypothetical protein